MRRPYNFFEDRSPIEEAVVEEIRKSRDRSIETAETIVRKHGLDTKRTGRYKTFASMKDTYFPNV
ncbi:hypothetical protein HY450_03625 [Candidatus Pacearchaeota archaeon]|nr:hypothetical protein [Candidatus Pacearchaeota archaeon]